jgi:hypothetical protein
MIEERVDRGRYVLEAINREAVKRQSAGAHGEYRCDLMRDQYDDALFAAGRTYGEWDDIGLTPTPDVYVYPTPYRVAAIEGVELKPVKP